MLNTLTPIRILNDVQLLLLCAGSAIRVLDPLGRSLGRGTRGRGVHGGVPLRGAGRKLHEVVLLGHAVPLRDPAFGERGRGVRGAFLAGSGGLAFDLIRGGGEEGASTLMGRSWLGCCAKVFFAIGMKDERTVYGGGKVLGGLGAKNMSRLCGRSLTFSHTYCIAFSAFSCAGGVRFLSSLLRVLHVRLVISDLNNASYLYSWLRERWISESCFKQSLIKLDIKVLRVDIELPRLKWRHRKTEDLLRGLLMVGRYLCEIRIAFKLFFGSLTRFVTLKRFIYFTVPVAHVLLIINHG